MLQQFTMASHLTKLLLATVSLQKEAQVSKSDCDLRDLVSEFVPDIKY